MVELKNVTIILKNNGRPLIKDLNVTFNKGDKVAIIGEEGNGKSTLIKFIYDSSLISSYCNFEGQIVKKDIIIGYLEQSLSDEWNDISVCGFFLKENPNDEINYDKYNELSAIFSVLSKFRIDSEFIYSNQKVGTLSGGEKVKIQLAKIIYSNPDVLLLDEPTNDLDIETLEWLEEFINATNVPVIFISHDETLLENTANTILHLEQVKKKSDARHTIEKISYREYVEKRLGMIRKQEQIARKQRAEHQAKMERWRQIYQKVDYQLNTITRADPHGARLLKKKMKSLKSQEKRLEREKQEFLDIPDVEEGIYLDFDSNIYIPNSKNIINLSIEQLTINDKLLSSNIKLVVNGPQHLVIIGRNGIGKTTLLERIYNEIHARTDINVGYMPQYYETIMDPEQTAIDFIKTGSTVSEITKARTFMGCVKFTSEEMTDKIGNLSGGQKAKLLLLKLILQECNVLLLDEPTRNLSPLSNPIIRSVLAHYNGAIISVSHDRKYIDEVCDVVYELTTSGLKLKER
jgi:ATPase subunit of ABC transporter with duplicated ATPase domains